MGNNKDINKASEGFHLTFEVLLDYLERRLDAAESTSAEEHLQTCARCQADISWLEETTDQMASDRWIDSPLSLRFQVKEYFREAWQQPSSKVGEDLSLADRLRSLLPRRSQLAFATAMALALLVVGTVLYQTWVNRSQPLDARVEEVSGPVEVQTGGQEEWAAVQEESVLGSGDSVRTGDGASLSLDFTEETVTRVEPNAQVKILEATVASEGEKQVIVLRQDSGVTHNKVQKLPSADSRFEIRTPAAVISVRGTEFIVDVAEDGTTAVDVIEGLVHVTAQGTTVALAAGQDTVVQPGSRPQAVETVDPPTQQPTSTPTSTQTRRPTPTLRPSPTGDAEQELLETPLIRGTPTPTSVVPTLTPVPSTSTPVPLVDPTDTPEGDGGDGPKKTPPGHTKTPEPPGQTKTPEPQGPDGESAQGGFQSIPKQP